MTDFGDNVDEPRIEEALQEAVRAGSAKVRTIIPGKVTSYDHDNQSASVRPVIRSSYKDPDTKERETYLPPEIPNCPVNFPQGGGFSITWPLQAGDPVELRICSRSIEEWKQSGGEDIEPVDPRRHDLSDVIVDPGVRSFANALDSDAIDDSAIVVAGKEIHLGRSDPANWAARDDRVEDELQKIVDYLKDFQDHYNKHQHTRSDNTALIPIPAVKKSNDSVSASQGVSGAPPDQTQGEPKQVGDTASDKVKAE